MVHPHGMGSNLAQVLFLLGPLMGQTIDSPTVGGTHDWSKQVESSNCLAIQKTKRAPTHHGMPLQRIWLIFTLVISGIRFHETVK